MAGGMVSCAVCFVLQRALWDYLESRDARFIAENYSDMTMIRLQRLRALQGGVGMLLGSSMTERIGSGDGLSSVGVPGSSFLAGLELLKRSEIELPKLFIMEVNNMFSGVDGNVMRKTEKWDFRFFADSRHFSIAARPSSLLYSAGYYLTRGAAGPCDADDCFGKEPLEPVDLQGVEPWNADMRLKNRQLVDSLQSLKSAGYFVVFAFLPTRREGMFEEQYRRALGLAKLLDIPVLNYQTADYRGQLMFSDTHHMVSQSPVTWRFRRTLLRDALGCVVGQ